MADERYVRISDVIVDAFDEACDQQNLEVAEALHTALELVMTRRAGPKDVEKRAVPVRVLNSYERLDALRKIKGLPPSENPNTLN